ncbi:MAG: hypothetical protein LBB87_03250 [Nitrososphaerota archaeon]|jgi:hypothetical protein|nr:hypothetical protein [Nitrososphaerota archaeon]
MSICETKKIAMPLSLERDSILPLECNTLQKDFDAYKKAITKTIEKNIELLKELPPPKNFTVDELVEYFQKEIKKDLENNKLFEKSVEIGRYAHSIFESMTKYFANIYDFNKEEREKNSYDVFSISRLFLNSNLPDEFFKTVSNSYLIENDFLNIFDRKIKRDSIKLIGNKNNRVKFTRVCDKHNLWVKDFTDKLKLIGKNRTKLIWYVEINNSNKLEELFNPKFLKEENLDKAVLLKLIDNVAETTNQLEELVLNNLEKKYLPTTTIDEGIKTITNLMDTITG